ncbi:ATP-grasp domain-containing protein [Pseudomonas sp. MPFS]|uniref:ATP-grasp domain-containing protein n=1 Tax=Pseudomonas sp. MPFS TaxID=2795724 RepID=UPI001F14484F|nr:ATP-grasp domain-containing protein [Pseudomonas sp. MPFS]UMZ11897.1 ATP-grasp domain-containing protein [Pseudomonas sp. MPFS]
MLSILALGSESDLQDYVKYCHEHDREVVCFLPPPLLQNEKSHWEAQLIKALHTTCTTRQFDHVVSFHDGLQVQVDIFKKIFGLATRDTEALFTLTDKSAFKSVPATANFISRYLRLPQNVSTDEAWQEIEQSLRLPIVLKPSNAFYSAGVIRVDDRAGFSKALTQTRHVCSLMASQRGGSEILVEEYIDGEEFSVDGYVLDGEVTPLLLHHKYPRLEGPTFHENAQISIPFDKKKGEPFMVPLRQIIAAVGLDQSPFHSEFRITADQRVYILELAPRISGDGISSRYLMDICLGLDVYDVDLKLDTPQLTLDLPHRRVGLEYDFSVKKSGVLSSIEKTVAQCHEMGATTVIQHRHNGEFVMAPPDAMGSILTAFFTCESKEQALRIFDFLETCEVETQANGE